jgi:hypothetical protein
MTKRWLVVLAIVLVTVSGCMDTQQSRRTRSAALGWRWRASFKTRSTDERIRAK